MPEVIATACSLYGLRPLEALAAATVNAAAVLGLAPGAVPWRPAGPPTSWSSMATPSGWCRTGRDTTRCVRTFVDGERVGGR